MYLLPFCFSATIFITLHSSSEQVLPILYFQCSSALWSWLCIDDLFIASWHSFGFVLLGFKFFFCLILVQTASVQTPKKLHYSAQNLLWSAEHQNVIIAQIDMSFCKMLSRPIQSVGSWGFLVKQNKSHNSEKTFLLMPEFLERKTAD